MTGLQPWLLQVGHFLPLAPDPGGLQQAVTSNFKKGALSGRVTAATWGCSKQEPTATSRPGVCCWQPSNIHSYYFPQENFADQTLRKNLAHVYTPHCGKVSPNPSPRTFARSLKPLKPSENMHTCMFVCVCIYIYIFAYGHIYVYIRIVWYTYMQNS